MKAKPKHTAPTHFSWRLSACAIGVLAVTAACGGMGGGNVNSATTNTPTPTATYTNTPTPTATNTNTPTPTATYTNTPTPTATFTNTSTPTANNTNTPTPTATYTSTPTPTATFTNTPTPTATNTNTPTPTATFTNTPTPAATNTDTPAPTATYTSTPTPTATNTDTPTPTATYTNTPTPTATSTGTPTPTATNTETPTPTATNTSTPTPSPTPTPLAYSVFYSLPPSGDTFYGLESDGMGNFYGTQGGSENNNGAIFKITNTGNYSLIYHFKGGVDGRSPRSLTYDGAGKFYGITCHGGGNWDNGSVFTIDTSQTYNIIKTFINGNQDQPTSGRCPNGKLALGNNGRFYGTTSLGGDGGTQGNGVVFSNDSISVLRFPLDGSKGRGEPNGMTSDGTGNFYGVTASGTGSSAGGTIFKISNTGQYSLFYSFAGGIDGASPMAALIRDNFGNFYGTTSYGGNNGKGTIFKITPTGIKTTIHHFSGGGNGSHPKTRLISDGNGNFYGTTNEGSGVSDYFGVIFKITESGDYSVLYSFSPSDTKYATMNQHLISLETIIDGYIYGVIPKMGVDGTSKIFKFPVN